MKYYYVYRITNTVHKKHYYGKRCSLVPPEKDLGVKYFSSSKNSDFMQDQINNSCNYRYKIVRIVATSEEATKLEIKLHSKFDVGKNPSFYNIVKQTSVKFDSTGVRPTAATLALLQIARRGRKCSEKAKERMRQAKYGNSWNIGRKHTELAKEHMRLSSKKGDEHHNSVYVNIFNTYTKELVAEHVILSVWCNNNHSLRSNLAMTLTSDITKPSTRKNPWNAKGMYARYFNA